MKLSCTLVIMLFILAACSKKPTPSSESPTQATSRPTSIAQLDLPESKPSQSAEPVDAWKKLQPIPLKYSLEERITPVKLPEADSGAIEELIAEFDAPLYENGEAVNAKQGYFISKASPGVISSFVEIEGIRYDLGRIGAGSDSAAMELQLESALYSGSVFSQGRFLDAKGQIETDYYEIRDQAVYKLFTISGLAEDVDNFETDENWKIWVGQTSWLYKYEAEQGMLYGVDLLELFDCASVDKTGYQYNAKSSEGELKATYALEDGIFQPLSTGGPDLLGSMGSISEVLERPDDWKQIVKDSEFKLGDFFIKGYWGPEDDRTPYGGFRYGSYPRIDGSTVCVPIAIEFARQHLGLSDSDARLFVSFNTTHEAYAGLISGKEFSGGNLHEYYEEVALAEDHPTDLVIATYPSDEELAMASQQDIALKIEPVCYDAFVFITHKDNPVDSLTLEQVRMIYSGGATNWSEVGGDDLPIIAYQREPNSGSQSGMEQLVMNGADIMSPEMAKIVEGMGNLVEAVAEYQNGPSSIGYTYKYYIDHLYKNDSVKILKIDGIAPDREALASKAYPLSVSYYGIIRENDGEDSTGRKFLDWMLSKEGQSCIEQAGYVPISGD
ncbi:MAG: substrate-binding domain-containing protein [Clostridiales bacterium]|jgi:phosphate transport system substrate-binding protein|nr:substrate-binding domain-containing protein [Clostridiales bacterium]